MSANMKMSIDCKIIYKLDEKKILKYNIEMVKLEDYTTSELKKMISSFNKLVKFSAYSKLKKAEIIKMIRTHPKIKVEEGSNAVKLSIKTDENFEKQTKVKKEKVKKEVKKEVAKLDDVKVEVKPLTVTKADGTKKELKMKPKKLKITDKRVKKEEPKKEEPKEDKEKAVDDLLKQIKKSYDKNKPKLDKMTDKKYKTVFNTKLVELYDDVEDIYQEDLTTEQRFNLRKRFSAIIPFKKEEPKKEEPKKGSFELVQQPLNKLVATARSHAKNGISVEGLKDFFNKVEEYKETNPPKLQSQLAGILYNFLNNNIQMGKKKLPNNMNKALKELGYKKIIIK